MKTKTTLLALLVTSGIVLIFFSGCYTQLGSTRNAYDDDQEYTEIEESGDTTYVAENEDDSYTYNYGSACCDDYRPRVGFSYYYPSSYWPSTAFSVAYANPWSYDYYWGIDPYSYYYSPYTGHSFGWYPSYFYSPYYYGYGYYYSDNWSQRGRRTDGSMRSYDVDRSTTTTGYGVNNTSRFNDDLPSAASYRKSSGGAVTTDRRSATVRENSRTTTNQRTYGRRDARTSARTNNTNSRGTGQRNVEPRRTATQPRPSSPPAYQPPSRENRGSTPSYTPPSAAPSRQPSSPPPPNDSGRRTDGGSRSSGSRDKKP